MSIIEFCDRKLTKLEIAVLDFLTVHDVTYHIHGGFPKMYTCYFRLDDTICIEQEVHIRDVDCLCYTNLSRSAKHLGSNWQEKILLNINKVNRTLDYGSFEVDLESGDIRYRTYFNPGNAVYWEDLDMFLGYPMQIIRNRYSDFQKRRNPFYMSYKSSSKSSLFILDYQLWEKGKNNLP